MNRRVLLIEDEPAIAENILFALRTEHFEAVWASTGGEGLKEAGSQSFDLVILDIGLPDISGYDACRQILAVSPDTPVLFLTARDGELDRVLGLELGADDYVTKPFSPRELTARVRAILRRSGRQHAAAGARAASGLLVHDPERALVLCRGKALELARTEYRLLTALMAHPGRVFSRDQLMELAWDDPVAASDRTVDAHVKLLRAKLRVAAPDADPIETRRGLGYALRES